KVLHNCPEAVLRRLNPQGFKRVVRNAVFFLAEDGWTGGQELKSLAAHLFAEDSDLHRSPRADPEGRGGVGFLDLNGNIRPSLTEEPVAELAGCDELALASSEGAVVDAEVHLDRGGGKFDKRKRLSLFDAAECHADVDFSETRQADDRAGPGFFSLGSGEPAERENFGDLGTLFRTVLVENIN